MKKPFELFLDDPGEWTGNPEYPASIYYGFIKEDYWERETDLHMIEKSAADKLARLLEKFLDHYDNRKITNGFHDLLAKEVRVALKEHRGEVNEKN